MIGTAPLTFDRANEEVEGMIHHAGDRSMRTRSSARRLFAQLYTPPGVPVRWSSDC
jgi:hypothetical protein